MKKIYFIIIALTSLYSFSQKDYSRYYNSWRLGLNLGGAWQTADYRSCWGMAGGITLEKGFHENSTNVFSFAIRGRYLGANTYGMDYNKNYNLKGNDAYNGKYDENVNYLDSIPIGRQYVYDNYKMKLGEGSLELQVTFNRLRERNHVLLNLWGGVGFTSYRTKSDLLDANGKLYNFSLVDSTGNKTKTLNTYNSLIDKKYESYAYGSKNGDLYTFSPSLGVGLGYQFSPGFSMLWEYKVTFPQGTNADLLDGKINTNNDAVGGNNDYYHYIGLNLLLTLRSKHKTKATTTSPEQTVYTNTVVSSNPAITPTTSVAPTNTVVTTTTTTTTTTISQPPIYSEPKPIISYITPPVNGHVVNNQQYKISAQILNVLNANQIQFKFNGIVYYNFSFNNQTHILEFNSNLNIGNNTIQIIATNTSGNDNKSTNVIYDLPKPIENPPIITYINPVQPGFISMNQSYIVKAQVLNVTDQNGISVYYNGISRSFTYDAFNKQVSFTANLNLGSNTISMTANNTVGEDTKITEVIYRVNKPTGDPPIVNLINPASQINATDNSLYNFRLAVLNVTAKSDIEVVFNGVTQTNFVYNSTTKIIDFQSNLIVGNNILYVKGTNQFGIDSKQISVNYTPHPDIKTPPLVTIINPLGSTAAINSPNYNFKATITNIATSSGLVVKFNGNIITNFSYDGLNLSYQATLIQGSNSIEIAATNNDGSDIKNANVIYKVKVVPVFPIVNLINPSSEINATDNILYNFKLAVLNVNAKSDIEVLLNGIAQTNFTYNTTSKEIDFQTNLIEGNNTLSVKGTNQFGFDIKQISVNYTPHADLKTPPIITFVNPINTTASSQNLNYIFSATIINMPSNNGLTVTYNGNMITNYTYDGLNLVYNSTLNIGANTLVILASNSDGNDTKTAVVNYKSKIIAKPPVVSIEHPIGTPTVNTLSYNFQFSALNVTQNQIEVTLNGLPITNFNFILPQGSFTSNLVQGQNIFSVKATNVDGTITKTENIFLVLPTDTSVTIAIDTTIGNSGNDKIIICHIPPGNNQNPQTITIPQSAWNAHNAHGDTKGACPLKITNPIIVNPKVVPNLNLQNENSPIKGKIDTINKQPINTPRRPR